MIEYGHVDVEYVHYGLDFYPGDANHTAGSLVKLFCNLEKPPVHSSCAFFKGSRMTPLYKVVLEGKEVCMSS
jgi:hypothetical protein